MAVLAIYRPSIYTLGINYMVVYFKSDAALDIYNGALTKHAKKIPIILHNKVRRLFDQMFAAKDINDLKSPPGNRLERLRGNLSDKWSIRINNQWRIVFSMQNDAFYGVDIVDYH